MKTIKLVKRRKWAPHPNSGAKRGYVRVYHPIVKWAQTAGPSELLEVGCEKRKHIYISRYLKENFSKETFKKFYFQKADGSTSVFFKKEKRRNKRVRVGRPKNKTWKT